MISLSGRRVETVDFCFADLPPRVIIHDILPFHIMILNPLIYNADPKRKGTDEQQPHFTAFGYFKKDRLRNVWFVFSSIEFTFPFSITSGIDSEMKEKNYYISSSRIEFLRISGSLLNHFWDDVKLLLRKITKESSRMFRLKKLEICDNHSLSLGQPIQNKVNLFPEDVCFPNLESLSVSSLLPEVDFIDTNEWHMMIHPFKRLTGFELFNNGTPTFLPIDFLKNHQEEFEKQLRILSLSGVLLTTELNLSLQFLQKLKLVDCSNLIIHTSDKLKELIVEQSDFHAGMIESKIVKESLRNAVNLRKLSLRFVHWNATEGAWFFQRIFNPLEKLEILEIVPFPKFTEEQLENTWWSSTFLPKLKHLEISNCENFAKFFHHPHPNLKTLILQQSNIGEPDDVEVEDAGKFHPKSLIELEEFRFIRGHVLSERLFRECEIPKLSLLKIEYYSLDGSGWKNLNNVSRLYLMCLTNHDGEEVRGELRDDFFQNQSFANLEEMTLLNIGNITGKGWNTPNELKFSKLTLLRIDDCEKLGDDLFKENSFPVLKRFFLRDCPLVTGKGWMKMKSLEKFFSRGCTVSFEGQGVKTYNYDGIIF